MNRKAAFTAVAVWVMASSVSAPAERAGNDLSFLVGDWVGGGSGQPGQGAGSFSFTPELQGRVLVRRAHSGYPARPGRTATVHDDLLIVYADQSKAIYFDNEGHVIHYEVSTDLRTKTATLLSVDPPPSPLFRLTYQQPSPDNLRISFEISPTGKAEDFKSYLTGAAMRKKPQPR